MTEVKKMAMVGMGGGTIRKETESLAHGHANNVVHVAVHSRVDNKNVHKKKFFLHYF